MFVQLFKIDENDPIINPFVKYYISLVVIKDFNALIDNKPFFDQLVKSKQKAYERLVEMSRNDDYVKRNLLDYSYSQNYHKHVDTDL